MCLISTPVRKGFTFTELCVVIAIIVLAMALMMPAVLRIRRSSANLQCANNLRKIGLALHDYAGDHDQTFPAGTIGNGGRGPSERLSWYVEVLPHLEEDRLFARFDRTASWNSVANASVSRTRISLLLCPDWRREFPTLPEYFTAYVGLSGIGPNPSDFATRPARIGFFASTRAITYGDIHDGTSETLMLLETCRDNGPWAQGGPATVRDLDSTEQPYLGKGRPFGGTHFAENTLFSKGRAIGCHALLADVSVRFVRDAIAPEVLEALITIAGDDSVGDLLLQWD